MSRERVAGAQRDSRDTKREGDGKSNMVISSAALEKLNVCAVLLLMNLSGPACDSLDAASGRRPVGKRTGTAGSLELGELFLVKNHVESRNREKERERKPNEREDRDSMLENRDDDSDDDDDSR